LHKLYLNQNITYSLNIYIFIGQLYHNKAEKIVRIYVLALLKNLEESQDQFNSLMFKCYIIKTSIKYLPQISCVLELNP
jgi:hypothetical protein